MVIDAEALVIRKRLEQSLKELPPLPVAVAKVLDETNKPEPDLHKIDDLISSDHAIASKVLRIVNSAYYGLSRQVTSINAAVMILGIQQIKTITLSVGSIAAFSKTTVDAEGSRRFWEHSFATSATCQVLGSKLGLDRKSLETLGSTGILHDIGRMFIFCNFKSTYDGFVKKAIEQGITYEEAEYEFLGDNHAGIGAMIAEKWGLPVEIVSAIRAHEGPFEGEINQGAATLYLADWLNKGIYYSESDAPIGELSPVVMTALGVSDDVLSQIRETVRKKVSEASQLYGMVAA
jgi:putative nucleotidyltransferase with HDIG domain